MDREEVLRSLKSMATKSRRTIKANKRISYRTCLQFLYIISKKDQRKEIDFFKLIPEDFPHCIDKIKTDTAADLVRHLLKNKQKIQFPLKLNTYVRFNPNYQSYYEITLS